MPNKRPADGAQPKQSPRTVRWAAFGVGCAAAILGLAYFDGGEEPIHLIIHPVEIFESE